jgi:hypothetical protein
MLGRGKNRSEIHIQYHFLFFPGQYPYHFQESMLKFGEISKYNPMFAYLTSYDPRFVSLSKYNPEARELFNSGVFYPFSQFRDFVLPISSPAQVKGQFCPYLIPFISSLHRWHVGPKVGVVFNLGLAPETAARGSIGSRRHLPCLARWRSSRPVARAEVGPASMATARPDLNPTGHAIPDGRAPHDGA